jgi:hypothetical protein
MDKPMPSWLAWSLRVIAVAGVAVPVVAFTTPAKIDAARGRSERHLRGEPGGQDSRWRTLNASWCTMSSSR